MLSEVIELSSRLRRPDFHRSGKVFCENEGSGWKWSGKEGNKLIHINSH